MRAKGIHKYGLTNNDLNYINILKRKRLMGVRNISHTLNIEEKTVKTTIEPYLMKLGLVYIGPAGKRAINFDRCIELGL